MSRSLQEEVHTEEDTGSEDHELYLRNGRKIVVSDNDQLVEIRSASGMLELRIKLTDEGPILQMESVRMQLKATESVEIEAARVDVKATEKVTLAGNDVAITAENEVDVDAKGDVDVHGKMILLNC